MNSGTKIDFYNMTQEDLRDYCDIGETENNVDEYQWAFSNLEIEHIRSNNSELFSEKEWISWLAEEQVTRLEEWGYDSITKIEDYWLKDPIQEPLIFELTKDGKYRFVDGYHRFAIAIKNKVHRVPVLLGTPFISRN